MSSYDDQNANVNIIGTDQMSDEVFEDVSSYAESGSCHEKKHKYITHKVPCTLHTRLFKSI